ncbi:MAG: SH3 domain-containing protein [Bacteroidia bacterium]
MKPSAVIKSPALIPVFLLLVFSGFSTPVTAQNCLSYERELEQYFLSYQSGDRVDLDYIERMKWRCDQPTAKMELIYYFFKSVVAFRSENLSDREAYEQATYYYDLCAKNFPWLTRAGNSEAAFTEMFFEKAEGLEAALATLAYELKIYPESRKYGETDDNSVWSKNDIAPLNPASGENSRGMDDPASGSFDKKYVYQGKYVNENYEAPRPRIENGEPYGWVGNLGTIDPINYVKWNQTRSDYEWTTRSADTDGASYRTAEPAVVYDPYILNQPAVTYDPSASTYRSDGSNYREAYAAPAPAVSASDPYYLNDEWVEKLEKSGTPILVYVSNRDLCPLYAEPGAFGRQIGFLSFGETVAQIKGENNKPTQRDGFNYLPVVNDKGQKGWVELSTVVRDGRLATFTKATRGYVNVNSNTSETERTADRNAILFQAGELVVLTGINKTNVKVLSQTRDKEGWLSSTESLSIDPLDVHVAFQMQEAMKQPAARDQQQALIRLSQEYPDSELTPVVVAKVQELQKITGFSPYR